MKQPEPIHHPLCARLSASGEFVFPDTACNCGGYRSLEDYLRADYARGIVGHELRVSLADDDRVLFYVHPMNVDGDMMDFEVRRNRLTPNPRVGRIGATHPLEGEASKEPTP